MELKMNRTLLMISAGLLMGALTASTMEKPQDDQQVVVQVATAEATEVAVVPVDKSKEEEGKGTEPSDAATREKSPKGDEPEPLKEATPKSDAAKATEGNKNNNCCGSCTIV
jgi:hypothetical protein